MKVEQVRRVVLYFLLCRQSSSNIVQCVYKQSERARSKSEHREASSSDPASERRSQHFSTRGEISIDAPVAKHDTS